MDPIHPSVRAGVDRLAREFAAATPFRHVVVDGFLDEALCRRLLAEFPGFEARHAINELGQVGGKAVRPDVRDISATYRALDDHIRSPDFLDLVGRITGIPGLLYDPDYVGGGTHENVHGQGLDAHVDFNYHPGTRWHRRLNLIVYLNPEWDEAWGGALELQSDPWDPQHNRVRAVAPLFNRCVIFETNEISWHGFRRIELPEERRGLSRKSFAIYLYTRERPATETAPSHATVYVPDGMPEGLQAGAVLSAAQVEDLSARFAHLRGQLRFLYEREKQFTAQLAALEGALAEARDRLARHLEHQPPVDTTLDQAPCTAETALARAALLYRSGALEGKRVVILGDDDSVSLAIGLVGKAIAGGPVVSRLTVLELDPARAAFIGQVAAAEGIPVEVIAHDLREPLPEGVAGAFDTAETDPPYTLEGAGLFLARAVEALEGGRGDVMFSFAHWPAGRMLDLQRVFLDLGLAVASVHPGFNAYQGASMLAGSGQLFELTATGATAFETGRWDGPLYTADVNPRLRAYRCLACTRVTVLGRDGVPATIEALKARGCPACGADRFVRASA